MNAKSNIEKHVLVATLRPVSLGEKYKKLPPHMTILPPFLMEATKRPVFDSAISEIAEENLPLTIYALGDELYGDKRKINAQELKGAYFGMHAGALAVANWLELKFDDTHTGLNYSAHVTEYDGAIHTGETQKLQSVQLFSYKALKDVVSIYTRDGFESDETEA